MADDVRPVKRLRTSEDEFEKYDVFISHRGPDTKTGFVGYLYEGLKCAGLRAFLDCKSIDKGQESWACIKHAIKTTPTALIVFSENYVESEWCLRELHVMLKTPSVKVLPVFYKIKPWEVRFPEGGQLANKFAKLKERHASSIEQWKVDLDSASKLNGWEYAKEDKRLENELVSEIVGRIFDWANKILPLDVGEHVIGVDIVAQKILHDLDLDKRVLMLGLWGMGGIGKSTIAKELYNRLRRRFATSSFVEDVSEMVVQGGIAKVQSCILEDLCNNKSSGIKDKSKGKAILEERLRNKRILVVLDNVSDNVEMEHLISRKMLSEGSMCIVTSRNKRVFHDAMSFAKNEVYIHDVLGLNYEDSRQVFTSFALGSGLRIDGEMEELVSCITRACGGVPLVLKVCGALLKNEDDMEIWKDVLKKLQCGSIMDEEKIFESLRISFDALQVQQREMFLDIACALLGQPKDWAIEVWRSQRWFATLGVRSLVERALVVVDEKGCFAMHDHLRDMGRVIVKNAQACDGVTRRLWDPESLRLLRIDEVLPEFIETLVIYEASNDKMEHSSIHLDLCRLKHLRIMRCQLDSKTTLSLPKNLKWFSLDQQGSRHTLPSFHSIPESSELVIWDVKGSNYEGLCESIESASMLQVFNLQLNYSTCRLPESFGSLGKLRTISLEWSTIEDLPESFGRLRSLEVLDMEGCSNLKKLPGSFGGLETLKTLYLSGSGIECLPESFGRLRSLEVLGMGRCSNLKKLPDSFGGLETLRILSLRDSGIESLPKSFGRLRSLEGLNMVGCSNLKKLPESFGGLEALKTLSLPNTGMEGLPNLKSFSLDEQGSGHLLSSFRSIPESSGLVIWDVEGSNYEGLCESIGSASMLQVFNLRLNHSICRLPESFGSLGNLRTISLQRSRIKDLPESFGRLRSLEVLDMGGCLDLEKLPDSFGGLETLRTLSLQKTGIECLPEPFGRLRSLEDLNMEECSNLKKLPDSFGGLETLRILDLRITGIQGLPESFGWLRSLEVLDMGGCSDLMKLPESFGGLETLRTLSLQKTGIECLPESFGRLRSLKFLDMEGFLNLKKLPDSFGGLETLRTLSLWNSKVEVLPESFGRLRSLEDLNMVGCLNLKKLPDSFGGLETLRILSLRDSGVGGLPESFGRLRSLVDLNMNGCSNLKKLPDSIGGLETLRTLNLQNIGIEGLPESFGRLRSLEVLDMGGCSDLKMLPDSFGGLETLRILNLLESRIEGLPVSFGRLRSLEDLIMGGCSNLKKLPDSFGGLETLRILSLRDSGVEGLPESFGRLRSLKILSMHGCSNLKKLPDSFGGLKTLRTLYLRNTGIECLPESFGSLRSLEIMIMGGCSNLKKLPDSFGGLETLKSLYLSESRIEGLPESFGRLRSLEVLDMEECSNLKKLPDSFGGLETLKTLNLSKSGIEGLLESWKVEINEDSVHAWMFKFKEATGFFWRA